MRQERETTYSTQTRGNPEKLDWGMQEELERGPTENLIFFFIVCVYKQKVEETR